MWQGSKAEGQRGANGQPAKSARRSGGLPGIPCSSRRSPRMWGNEPRGETAYGRWLNKEAFAHAGLDWNKYVEIDQAGNVIWENTGNRTLVSPASGAVTQNDNF